MFTHGPLDREVLDFAWAAILQEGMRVKMRVCKFRCNSRLAKIYWACKDADCVLAMACGVVEAGARHVVYMPLKG